MDISTVVVIKAIECIAEGSPKAYATILHEILDMISRGSEAYLLEDILEIVIGNNVNR